MYYNSPFTFLHHKSWGIIYKSEEDVRKQREYSNYRFKGIGTFIADNIILLKQYSNGSKIFIETALQKLPTGQSVPCPPYLLGITAPISQTQQRKIKLLREADILGKSVPKELIGSEDYILSPYKKLKIPKHLYVKTYGDVKDPSGKAALKKDYQAMEAWVKKRYKKLLKDTSLSKYYARYDRVAEELVGQRFGKVIITKKLSTERIKSLIYSKA